ncbi:MAG: SDR family oxidoreductase [Xanthobacteraceae bacterium]|nr:SDR family oxidoreductase [Xanthobacteraceae bacterium]
MPESQHVGAKQFAFAVTAADPGALAAVARFQRVDHQVAIRQLAVGDVRNEIAEAVAWMCSDRASFMTGTAHVIVGGYYAA